MAIIRPVSDLQRKVGELSRLAKETKEPIYLTKNGVEHLVLIDSAEFSELQKRASKAGGKR
ncbi:type II toxin-antitoxin system prevent-host-death family antitoxin [Slackia exigua]|uniref:type II toxin-antitoxin system prevent-host-death family antitoxin n=1 Tax=Slackia exigua TaxID=84109 RepID=UPI002004C906|nr:type II toxin-antitoxin system prevent-host-death family antitoxin [Slackia exigua]MCK6139726.1 type II toxin-antitoxin system prevent-host-death family antitoxin [Slackia exigua]